MCLFTITAIEVHARDVLGTLDNDMSDPSYNTQSLCIKCKNNTSNKMWDACTNISVKEFVF